MTKKARILTGDTPTGRLHLGHYVGSIENRLALQEKYDCYFLVANKHAFTTRANQPAEIRQSVIDIVKDWLAVGIDPQRSSIVLQSEVPAIDEMTFFLAMLLPLNRVLRNPTLADEIKTKGLGDKYSFGFPLYAVGQCADILAFRPALVPVGEDQLPHLEMTREVARRFNHIYCGVDPETPDADQLAAGGLLPVIEAKLGRVKRLAGIGAPTEAGGILPKMSKSLNNAIYLSDDADTLRRKVMAMYTDPNRLTGKEPGETDPSKNPLWALLDAFATDRAWFDEQRALYAEGGVGDVVLKRHLIDILDAFVTPIRTRRAYYDAHEDEVFSAMAEGTARANAITETTLVEVKRAMRQDFFGRALTIDPALRPI